MSVARISCPQLLDVSLRSPQEAVDVAAVVGVGGNVRHDPARQPNERLSQRVVYPEDALDGRQANLYLLCLTAGLRSARSVASSTLRLGSSFPSAPLR